VGESSRLVLEKRNRTVLLEKLRAEQKQHHEGSFEWADIQAKINQIVAQNYLEFVNN
jgi:hypothetical protein